MKKRLLSLLLLGLASCTLNKPFITALNPNSEDRVVSISQPITYQIDGFEVIDEIDPRYRFVFESRIKAPKSTESVFNGIVQATGVSFLGSDKMVITYNTKDNTVEGGFDIVNVSDLKNPVILKSFLLPEMEFADSKILGTKLYLSGVDLNNGAVLVTVDLSNINTPQLVDKKVLSSYYGTSLSLKDNNILVTSGDSNGHVWSFNLNSNGIPQLQWQDSFQNLLYVQHYANGYVVLFDEDGKTFLGYKNKTTNQLSKVNLRNVHFESPARFDISGNIAFVATADEKVIEVVDLSSMTKIKTIPGTGRGNGLKFDNGLLYTAQGLEGFKLFDVRDLNNIISLGRFDFNDEGAGNNVWTYTLGSKRVVVVADGLGGVKILSQQLTQLPTTPSCDYATSVVAYQPIGSIEASRKVPEKALGAPQGDSVSSSIEFVSLGKSGSLTLSFSTPVKNVLGKKDLKIYETTWDNKNFNEYPEKAEVYGSNDNLSWTYLGQVKNDNGDPSLGEIDLGSMSEAKYIKIVDSTTWDGAPDGFDVDAVQCLNQPTENIAGINGKDVGVLWKDGATKKIYRTFIDETNKKVSVYSTLNSDFTDSHIGLENDGRNVVELSGSNTKIVLHDLATKEKVLEQNLSELRITQVAIDPAGKVIVGNPNDNQLYMKFNNTFVSLGNIYLNNNVLDLEGGDIAFLGSTLYVGTQASGGQILKVIKDESSGKLTAEVLYTNLGKISGLAVYRDISDNKVKFLASVLDSQEMILLYENTRVNLVLQGETLSQSNSGDLAIRNTEAGPSPFSVCEPSSKTSCSQLNGAGEKTCNESGTSYDSCQLTSCNSGFTNVAGVCVAQVCSPNSSTQCIVNHQVGTKTCNNNGTLYGSCVLGNSCEAGYYYANGSCLAQVCSPNSKTSCSIANGTGEKTCDSSGSSYGSCQLTSCNSGFYSNGTSCVAQTCSPNSSTQCIENHQIGTKTCNSSGSSYNSCVLGSTCEAGYYYSNGSCLPQVCSPNSKTSCSITNGSGEKTCDSSGSSYGSCQLTSCNAGFVNVGGSCVPQVCSPNSSTQCSVNHQLGIKTCNSSGTEYNSCVLGSSCESGYVLSNGSCVPQVCTPNSNQSCQVNQGLGQKTCSNDGLSWGYCVDVSCNSGYTATSNLGQELITNGNFNAGSSSLGLKNNKTLSALLNEQPGNWDIFSSIPGWTLSSGSGIEVWPDGNGGGLLEMDSDPTSLGSLTNYSIIQQLVMESGTYKLSLDYKPRTSDLNDNNVGVYLNNNSIISLNQSTNSQPNWKKTSKSLVVNSSPNTLKISGEGNQTTFGGLIDNISLRKVLGNDSCVASFCQPSSSTQCSLNHQLGTKTCNTEGSAYGSCVLGTSCESGYVYSNGSCIPQVCSPNQTVDCLGQNGMGLKQCNSTGTEWGSCLIHSCNSGFDKTFVQSNNWTFCSNEYENCEFSGTKTVRYGKNGVFTTKTLTNGTACSNLVFGDPLVGVVKECDIQGHYECRPKMICEPNSKHSCNDSTCSKGEKTCLPNGMGYSECSHKECREGHQLINGKCYKKVKDKKHKKDKRNHEKDDDDKDKDKDRDKDRDHHKNRSHK